jgi:hypothetical protein
LRRVRRLLDKDVRSFGKEPVVKLKALVALVALGLAGASLAYAAPKSAANGNPHTGTTTTTSEHGKKPPCTPRVAVILKGTLNSVAGDKTSFSVHVDAGNHFAKAYKGSDTTVGVDGSTKFNRRGHHGIDDLVTGDRLVVRAAVCKADLANGATPSLTAKRVTAHPAKQS